MLPGALGKVLRKESGSAIAGAVEDQQVRRSPNLSCLCAKIPAKQRCGFVQRVRMCAESLCVLCGVKDESSTHAAFHAASRAPVARQPNVTLTSRRYGGPQEYHGPQIGGERMRMIDLFVLMIVLRCSRCNRSAVSEMTGRPGQDRGTKTNLLQLQPLARV